MKYITNATVMRYWRITLSPTREYYDIECSPIFKGKTVEGAIRAAKKYCKECRVMDKNHNWFNPYEYKGVLYECDYYGRERRIIWELYSLINKSQQSLKIYPI